MWTEAAALAFGLVLGATGIIIGISPYTRAMWQERSELRKANKRLVEENTHLRRNRATEQPDHQYTPKVIEHEVRVPPYKSDDWLVNPGGVEYKLDDIANGDWRNE